MQRLKSLWLSIHQHTHIYLFIYVLQSLKYLFWCAVQTPDKGLYFLPVLLEHVTIPPRVCWEMELIGFVVVVDKL